MNIIRQLAMQWWNNLLPIADSETLNKTALCEQYYRFERTHQSLTGLEIENIFYNEVILKWGIVQIPNIAYCEKDELIKIYLKEHFVEPTAEQKEQILKERNTVIERNAQYPITPAKVFDELNEMMANEGMFSSNSLSLNKDVEVDSWDELLTKFFYYLKYNKGIEQLEDSMLTDFLQQHYKLTKKQ
jgi:hypothetical protein